MHEVRLETGELVGLYFGQIAPHQSIVSFIKPNGMFQPGAPGIERVLAKTGEICFDKTIIKILFVENENAMYGVRRYVPIHDIKNYLVI